LDHSRSVARLLLGLIPAAGARKGNADCEERSADGMVLGAVIGLPIWSELVAACARKQSSQASRRPLRECRMFVIRQRGELRLRLLDRPSC
jgi:hypothetical protein